MAQHQPANAYLRKLALQPAGRLATPTEIEVATCLVELEDTPTSQIKDEVKSMKIYSATELPVGGQADKKDIQVILIAFPYKIFTTVVRKNQSRLISEMEKKLHKHVVVYGKRRVLTNKNLKSTGMKFLPKTRTLTNVQDSILEDIVGPTEIVGRRTRVRCDGLKIHKVYLDPKDKNKENIEEKLEAFTEVYRKLTSKVAVFSFDY